MRIFVNNGKELIEAAELCDSGDIIIYDEAVDISNKEIEQAENSFRNVEVKLRVSSRGYNPAYLS